MGTFIFLTSWEQNKSFLEQVELIKPFPIFLLSLIFHFKIIHHRCYILFHHHQPSHRYRPPQTCTVADPNTVHAGSHPPPIANPVMGFPPPPPPPPHPSTSTAVVAHRPSPPPLSPRSLPVTLVQPSAKKKQKPVKAFRKAFRNAFRSLPIITPVCKFPSLPGGRLADGGEARVSCTLFGYRKGRVSLSIQENPRTLPMMVVELAMQTHALQKELSLGMVRIAMECDKRPEKDKTKLMEEPVWTMYCNGKKNGYGARREATEEDLRVMEMLKAVSMGAGVIPPPSPGPEGPEGELAYVRAHFERVVGSKDSETLYMLSPDGSNGPDLSIYFVRV
ncbi:protein MIZU-KUSSEI 1 [Sesamum alatum]|uniref:Protein MIZU-KUSSEI 1 n=1 Tax=Sesamum alatum TaxID=300844 RepID=A0AAE2CQN4_9LAMI|nr:protein MIZU-KUSSEI 1 [Sesamum alatum]